MGEATGPLLLSCLVSLQVMLLFFSRLFSIVSCFILVSDSPLVSEPFLSLCVFPPFVIVPDVLHLCLISSTSLVCVYSPCLHCQFIFVYHSKRSCMSPSDSLSSVSVPAFCLCLVPLFGLLRCLISCVLNLSSVKTVCLFKRSCLELCTWVLI